MAAAGLALVLVMAAVGCTKSNPDRADMAKALEASGVPASEARCAADAIYANLTGEQVRQLVERGSGGTPKDDPARTNDAYDKLTKAMTTCRDKALGSQPTGGPITGSTTSTTSPPGAGSGGAPSSSDPVLDSRPNDSTSSTSSPTAGSTDDPTSTSQLPATTP